jgi:hypothetical protein
MPAKTPTAFVSGENARRTDLENCRYHEYAFADIDDGDTWTSNMDGVIRVGLADNAGNMTVAESSGTFTFQTDTENSTCTLLVWSRDYV